MENLLGNKIFELRQKLNLTQDQFGSRYDVSGPAIFKFEKNYVNPSLGLWLRIARDCGVTERDGVLLWAQAKLPKQYASFIDLAPPAELEAEEPGASALPRFMRIFSREELRQAIVADPEIPQGLRELIQDDDFWTTFKPTGSEVYAATQKFGMFVNGKAAEFAEALRIIRCFLSA